MRMFSLRRILTASLVLLATVPALLVLWMMSRAGSEAVDGQDCFVIEALPANDKEAEESGYSKRKLWIRKDISYTVKREFYDKKNQLEKVETDRKLVEVVAKLVTFESWAKIGVEDAKAFDFYKKNGKNIDKAIGELKRLFGKSPEEPPVTPMLPGM